MTDFTPDRHRYPDAGAAGRAAATTPIRIVEYGDFECPGCQMLAPVLKELVDESNGRISLVFRHFPVFEIHPFALTAALAAEASGDKFWAMHDQLYGHQDRLDDNSLEQYARAAGVGEAVTGLQAQPYKAGVVADYNLGIAEGVRATPTIFLNGVRYDGVHDLESLRVAVAAL